MPSTPDDFLMLPVHLLRTGLFVHLDLGWMAHPFPRGRFRLSDPDEIATLGRLGVRTVRVAHAGHFVHLEQPDPVHEAIIAHLR